MSLCKYCQKEINWNKDGDRPIPMNPDGTRHDCRKREEPKAIPKHMGFHEAEEAMAKKETHAQPESPIPPAAQKEIIPIEGIISVTIGSTISLGNYSNVHLEVVATDAETARQNFKNEIAETVALVRKVMMEVSNV